MFIFSAETRSLSFHLNATLEGTPPARTHQRIGTEGTGYYLKPFLWLIITLIISENGFRMQNTFDILIINHLLLLLVSILCL